MGSLGTAASATPQVSGFVVFERLASGGFGDVYRAHQESTHRDVALKVLRPDADEAEDRHARRQFAHEKRLMGELGAHPHIVAVHAAGETTDGRPYIALDIFDGSYADHVAAHGPLPPAEAIAVARAVAAALARAHHHGTLHRDVKPDNVLRQAPQHLGDDLRIALGDFGIARDIRRTEHSRTLEAMSFEHSAPEVLRGRPPTYASDLYSLGSTLYQLLTGSPPFPRDEHEVELAYIQRALTDPITPIDRPDVPAPFLDLVADLLARAVDDRIASASEVVERLDRVSAATPLPPAEPPTPSPPPGADHAAWMPGAGSPAPPPTGGSAGGLLPGAAASSSATGHLAGAGSATGHRAGPPAEAPAPAGVGGLAPNAPPTAAPTGYLPHAGERVDEPAVPEAPEPRRTSRTLVIVGVAAAVIVLGLLGVVLFGGSDADEDVADTTVPPALDQVTPALAPTDLEVEDRQTSVVLTWTSNVAEDVQYLVTWAGTDGSRNEEPIVSELGVYRVEVASLDPDLGYCFTVATVGSDDTALTSAPTCIRDATAGGGAVPDDEDPVDDPATTAEAGPASTEQGP
jgi:serine/threonine-protein kinase PknK